MNRTSLLCLIVCSGFLALVAFMCFPVNSAQAQPQTQSGSAPKLHLADVFTTRGRAVIAAADNIERNDAMVRLRGNVEIKLRPSSPSEDMMVLRADEADYDRKGDQVIPRGHVRIAFEKPQ